MQQQQGQDNSSSNWQGLTKTDSTSDAGDDASSIKSGSTSGTNNGGGNSSAGPQLSQDLQAAISTAAPSSSSSPWSNPALPGMDAGPWAGGSASPASTSLSLGWAASSTPNISQGLNSSMPQGSSAVGSSINLTSASSSAGGWPTGNLTSMPPNISSANSSSQWSTNNMLGNMDFKKNENSSWSNPSSMLDKDNMPPAADPRIWGMNDKPGDQNWEPSKSQWGNTPAGGSGDNNAELTFANVAKQGLKFPPAAIQSPEVRSRNEEILKAIENHEGWGSRPIRQDTSWEQDNSPKNIRKFPNDNSGASNVWNNSNGTAIWESVRESQGGNWGGQSQNNPNNWNPDKDQNWTSKQHQDNNWGMPGSGGNNDPKFGGTWDGGAGDASNKMWAQKNPNSIGSWDASNPQRPPNISSWQDDGDSNTWEDSRRITSGMNAGMNMVPPTQGPNSSMAGMMPQGMPGMSGMGDSAQWNSANPPPINRNKMDEWNASKPPPPKSNWGDPQGQMKVDDGTDIWSKPGKPPGPGWDGQQNNQWNSKPMAPGGWDQYDMMNQRKQMPPNKNYNSNSHPPQMRAKALQQLMDMGFRKEEAQNALITNNMDVMRAIGDLKSNNGMHRKDMDMDMFQANMQQQNRMPYMPKHGMGGDDMNDMQSDQVPNFSSNLPNTPFPPNAQMPNQPFNPSLPPSSLNHNHSINPNLQQRLQMHKVQGAPPVMGPRGVGMPPVGVPGNTQPMPQQQPVSQSAILAQLKQAVSNGFISPQLLNHQLPRDILVLLQQLLQLQQMRSNVMTQYNQLKQSNTSQSRMQQEKMHGIVTNINQQISNLQKQLSQAQASIIGTDAASKMPPPPGRLPNMSQPPTAAMMNAAMPGQQSGSGVGDNIDAISSEIANVSINPQAPQSRLTNIWKAGSESGSGDGSSTPTIPSSAGGNNEGDDKKSILQSSSSPNLTLFTNDRTWSSMSATTSSWPPTSSEADAKTTNPSSTGTTSSNAGGAAADGIPEFVPGKPWTGLQKSIEDDPHITPGSIQRSISVNRVHDDALTSLDAKSTTGNMGKNESSSFGLSHLGNRPPPNMAPGGKMMSGGGQQWQGQQGGNPMYGRQNTWGGRSNPSAFTQVGNQNWGGDQNQPSTWIQIKIPNSALDANTVKALCGQHGNLASFIPGQGQAGSLVQYSTREQAFNAVQRLNGFPVGNSVIGADMISEAEANRAMAQNPPPQPGAMPPVNPSQWSHAPPSFPSGGNRGGDPWSSQQMQGNGGNQKYGVVGGGSGDPWGGSNSLWGDMGDHNSHQLLNNILTETM